MTWLIFFLYNVRISKSLIFAYFATNLKGTTTALISSTYLIKEGSRLLFFFQILYRLLVYSILYVYYTAIPSRKLQFFTGKFVYREFKLHALVKFQWNNMHYVQGLGLQCRYVGESTFCILKRSIVAWYQFHTKFLCSQSKQKSFLCSTSIGCVEFQAYSQDFAEVPNPVKKEAMHQETGPSARSPIVDKCVTLHIKMHLFAVNALWYLFPPREKGFAIHCAENRYSGYQ